MTTLCVWCQAEMATQPAIGDPRAACIAFVDELRDHLCEAVRHIPPSVQREHMTEAILRSMGGFVNTRELVIVACVQYGATSTMLRDLADALDKITPAAAGDGA